MQFIPFIPCQLVSTGSAFDPGDISNKTEPVSKSPQRSRVSVALGLLALCAFVVGLSEAAQAERICKSAIPMQALGGNSGFEFQGLRVQADGDLFTDFQLPDGQSICSFRLRFRDNDPNFNVTATLERKNAADGVNPVSNPQIMGKVASSGAKTKTRSKTDSTISNPQIDTDSFSYYVRVHLPPGNSIELINVCVTVLPTCP
jgi:hypothetical protein